MVHLQSVLLIKFNWDYAGIITVIGKYLYIYTLFHQWNAGLFEMKYCRSNLVLEVI